MTGPPIGTVTFLFTDIEGSTVLLQRLGDPRYAHVFGQHKRILQTAFAEQGGREIDTAGDALLVIFPSATDGLVAAVAAQRRLKMHPWPPDVTLRVRMGLHTGEPTPVGEDYVGLDLHRAARICNAGHGGQILMSQATANLVEGRLPADIGLRDLGAHRLKDLGSPERLFQVVHPAIDSDFPPIQSLDRHANNLPHQTSSFIGREREISEVEHLLSTTRVLTLTGTGGCGKTRLALRAAANVVSAYRDGVWLVDLAPLADPALVAQTIAAAVGVRELPGRPLLAVLLDWLRPKQLLLVLDNCEHLIDACAEAAASIVSACQEVHILATSREVLGIPGEVTWRVPPLSVPPANAAADMEALGRCDAVRLFVERATALRAGFALTAHNAPSVADVCRQLDGIPLAIELAAARVAVLPVPQIAARLSERFSLLTHGPRAASSRHRTLQAAIDWSYLLLTGDEQSAVRRLSIFAGGWTLEAAESVCGSEGKTPLYVLDMLTQLVMKSLVLSDEHNGSVRYRFLETVRQYGLARLVASGELADTKDRHLAWCAGLAGQAAPALAGPSQSTWFDRLEAEHDNFRAALEWSAQSGRADLGLRIIGGIWRFWYIRGHAGEGRHWLEMLLPLGGEVPTAVRAEALKAGGNLAVQGQADYASGRAFYEDSLALWRALGDKRGVATVLGNLAFVAANEGDLERERVLLEESLALRREVNDQWGIALALHNLGRMAFRRGDYAKALVLLNESLPIWLELQDKQNIAMVLKSLGLVASLQGDFERARKLLTDGLAIRCELGDKVGIAYQLEGFASLAAAQREGIRAVCLFGAAEALREAIAVPLLPSDRRDYERAVVAARSVLSEDAFAEAWARGRSMSLDDAIVEARRVEQESRLR